MSTTIKKPVNYLNNKDILKEIHESKNSYCFYTEKDYNKYDLIVSIEDSTLEDCFEYIFKESTLLKAKENRAARLNQENNTNLSTEDINTQDLVFRVMTWDHIPLSKKPVKKSSKKKSAQEILDFEEDSSSIFEELEDPTTAKEVNDMIHVKVNFPPFQHFKIDENNSIVCVGKSHWKGDLNTGNFSVDHGKITNKLAKMYLMLCDKYAMKYCYRNYTYNDEMRASAVLQLTYVGLRFNEVKSQNPFAYYTQTITNAFCRTLNTEKRNQNIRDDVMEINGLAPSWTRQGMGFGSGEVVFED